MYATNFKGAFYLIKEAMPHMLKRKGSNVVIISSFLAYNPIIMPTGFYAITKLMLVALNKILAADL
jgi:dehydrogenase/reductase SDR family protein 4